MINSDVCSELKNTTMNKSLKLSLLLLCLSALTMAQDFQGKAVYKSANKMDIQLDGQGMDPEMQKRVQAMLAKQSQKEYTLAFDAYSSLFTLNEALDSSPQQQGGMMFIGISADGGGDEVYKNTKEKRFTSQRDLFGKAFLVKDQLASNEWKLTKETKQIGQYTCYKATYDREQESFQSISINNEEENKTETTTKTITVEAWYTPDIPVAHGPQMYWGLPGLVMEVKNGGSTIICTEVVLNPKDKIDIKEPSKGKTVNEEEFTALMDEKMAEMEKMDRGGKQKGGGGHAMKITIGG
jgi:GLPGLI family protein